MLQFEHYYDIHISKNISIFFLGGEQIYAKQINEKGQSPPNTSFI